MALTDSRNVFDSLLELAGSDPALAIAHADAAITNDSTHSSAAQGLRVKGLASANLGDLRAAQKYLDDALDAAYRAQDEALIGEVQMTRAGVLAWAGDQEHSLAAIDMAYSLLRGVSRAKAQAQRGGIHYRLGNFTLAREDLDNSIGTLQSEGEMMWASHALTNRGLLNAYEGKIGAASNDLLAAKRGYASLQHAASTAHADQNLGWLALRSGDLPAALNFLDEAEEAFAALGTSLGQLWCDRAEALLAAHMTSDAKQAAMRAAAELRDKGLNASYADALLQAAQAALLAGDHESAVSTARSARELMAEQGRTGWEAYADYLVMRARTADGDLSAADLPAIRDAVTSLDAAGLRTEALHARLLAATIATEAGDFEACREYLVEASEARRSGPVELRTQGWVAAARLRLHAGDSRGAAAAARAGLMVLDDYQATLGGTMARLHVTGYGAELAAIGLRLALQSGSPRRLFDWLELTRAGALRSMPRPSSRDPEVASSLLQFRQIDEELRRATLNGEDVAALRRQRDVLQEQVRDRALRATAESVRRVPLASARDVLAGLGNRWLVQFGETQEGELIAVRLGNGRGRKFRLGPIAGVRAELDSLTTALRRLATGRGSVQSKRAALDVIAEASSRLDAALLQPLAIDAADDVVIVPTGTLYSVPWSLLPTASARCVSVAPSASIWLALNDEETSPPATEASVIAGPRLALASEEVDRVAELYPNAIRLVEPTAADAAKAIDGAAVAHIACHGDFRADNPLFSALEMGDGALTIYDLEALHEAPGVVVLSACDAGANTSTGGHEVMGLATSLLAQGTRSVVANVGLVPDQAATIELMVRLHRHLQAGATVRSALASALPELSYEDDSTVAARAFVTFGV